MRWIIVYTQWYEDPGSAWFRGKDIGGFAEMGIFRGKRRQAGPPRGARNRLSPAQRLGLQELVAPASLPDGVCLVTGCAKYREFPVLCHSHQEVMMAKWGPKWNTGEKCLAKYCKVGRLFNLPLCQVHLMRWLIQMDRSPASRVRRAKLCQYEGCGVRVLAKGFCSMHYARFMGRVKTLGMDSPPFGKTDRCRECGKKTYRRDLCQTHYRLEQKERKGANA